MTVLSRLLTITALTALTFATDTDYRPACKAVEAAISNASSIYYPGNLSYIRGKHHVAASSEDNPACVVEPGTPEDVGKILNVIEATKTPFAVMSGGHSMNPGFSATKGIHIYTGKFSQVTYDPTSGTAVIGSGLIWDTVYEQLQNYDVTVLGGRVTGVGVGGFILGGGYSFKTNQYGLAIDTIVGFNLVLPNGTVTYVTEPTYPDLFFGLKGGFNNFGIVTDFTLKAVPQTRVWGGQVAYSSLHFDDVRAAIANFSAYSEDPKAAILPSYISVGGYQGLNQGIFYDDPTPPPGIFDNFTNIPSVSKDLKTRSYLDMILSSPSNSTAGLRGSFRMVGVKRFSVNLLKAIEGELTHWTTELTPKGGVAFSYSVEPFLPSYLSHTNSPSAFPPPAARQSCNAPNLLLVYFAWGNPLCDTDFIEAMEKSTERLSSIAQEEGLLSDNPSALYGNYMNADTPLASIYGDNLPSLRALKARIDPKNVMGLAGGFKF